MATAHPTITLLPVPSLPAHAYVVRAPGERYCVAPAPVLQPRPGAWHTRASWPGSTAAYERASALPAPVACALAAALSVVPGGRPPAPATTPDAALIDAAKAAGSFPSRLALAAACAARMAGPPTAGAVARAFTRACAPRERGWRGGAGPLSEEIREALRGVRDGRAVSP